MITYGKHSMRVWVCLAAVITPPDVFSMILVVLPLIILYEVSIILTKRTAKKYQQDMGKE